MSNYAELMKRSAPEWPYPVHYGKENEVSADVLIVGGGIAGCWSAISAARKGLKVVIVEKGSVIHSGQGGTGCDHWHFVATNPACKVTPEELAQALVDNHGGWNCGIHRYIQCRESYDTLLELEKLGVKIRDTEGEFTGAEFRDEKSKLLFCYDYENKYSVRFWGTGVKPALERECKRLGVEMYNRVMATSLLTEGGKQGARVVGATGFNVRTGEFYIFKAKATMLCLSRPDRQWVFSTELTGMSDGQPTYMGGDGHAMAWRAGGEFTLMERGRSFPCTAGYPRYGTGNPDNTWHPCTMVDANGKEIPWVDRGGRVLSTVSQRNRPAPGQKFFLMGGGTGGSPTMAVGQPGRGTALYQYMPPTLIPDLAERIMKGEFVLPLYADLPSMPEHARRVIFGLMVGQEGKTNIAIYANYTQAGFDPDKDMLQATMLHPDAYNFEMPWFDQPAMAPRQWRDTAFAGGGGVVVDWDLKTNLDGLYAPGAGGCPGASATGRYAGRKATAYAQTAAEPVIDRKQVEEEKARVYAPIKRKNGIEWKELNAGICRVMQDYCNEPFTEQFLNLGLKWFEELRAGEASAVYARNPHELMRSLESLNLITTGEMIMYACLARKASSNFLHFTRLDYPEVDPPEWHKWITTRLENGDVKIGELPIDYWGSLEKNYEAHCGL